MCGGGGWVSEARLGSAGGGKVAVGGGEEGRLTRGLIRTSYRIARYEMIGVQVSSTMLTKQV